MNNNNYYVMIPNEDILDIKKQLEDLQKVIEVSLGKSEDDEWLDSESARQFLGVSTKTWQEYRNKRLFPFAQIGRKIYVKRSELDRFVEQHVIKSINQRQD